MFSRMNSLKMPKEKEPMGNARQHQQTSKKETIASVAAAANVFNGKGKTAP